MRKTTKWNELQKKLLPRDNHLDVKQLLTSATPCDDDPVGAICFNDSTSETKTKTKTKKPTRPGPARTDHFVHALDRSATLATDDVRREYCATSPK